MRSSPTRLAFAAIVAALPSLLFANQAEAGGRRCRKSCQPTCCYLAPPPPPCSCTGPVAAAPAVPVAGGAQVPASDTPRATIAKNFMAARCADPSLRVITQGSPLSTPLTMTSVTNIGFITGGTVRLIFFDPTNYSQKWGYLDTTVQVYDPTTLELTVNATTNLVTAMSGGGATFTGAGGITITLGGPDGQPTGTATRICYTRP